MVREQHGPGMKIDDIDVDGIVIVRMLEILQGLRFSTWLQISLCVH